MCLSFYHDIPAITSEVPIAASSTPPNRGSISPIFLETTLHKKVAIPSITAPCRAGTWFKKKANNKRKCVKARNHLVQFYQLHINRTLGVMFLKYFVRVFTKTFTY
jgi:hypothetical protein